MSIVVVTHQKPTFSCKNTPNATPVMFVVASKDICFKNTAR